MLRFLLEVSPPEKKRQLKILNVTRQPESLRIALQRIGKDGKFEAGDVHLYYFKESGELVFRASRALVPEMVILFSVPDVKDRPGRLTFLLPDDPEVRTGMEVPPLWEELKPRVKSAGQRISEAWQRGRRGEWSEAKNLANVLPLAAVVSGVAATALAFRGPEGPRGK